MIDQALKQNAKEDEQAKENVEDTIVDDVDMSIEDIEKLQKIKILKTLVNFQIMKQSQIQMLSLIGKINGVTRFA